MTGRRNAAERVRDRVREWFEREGRGSKKRLAANVPAKYGGSKSQPWVTSIQKTHEQGGQDIRLADLDDVAEMIGQRPGELVREDGHNYFELTMTESRLVQYYRDLPETIRTQWMHVLDYLFRPPQHDPKGKDRHPSRPRGRRGQKSPLRSVG